MKILIFVDMEGIASVVKAPETGSKEGWWERFRITMTNEVNAAIEGALKAGVKSIDVIDWHGGGINILPDKLHIKANLIRGANNPALWNFVGKKTHDAAFILGIHGKHGSSSVLSHTMNGITETEINGSIIGEIELIAGFCGHYDIPVVLISSDKETIQESKKLFGDVQSVITKESISQFGARCFHPDVVCKELEKKAKAATEKNKFPKIFKFKLPLEVKFHFSTLMVHPTVTQFVSYIPTAKMIDEKTVLFKCDSILDYYKILHVVNCVAAPIYASIFK
ncbi:MAG: hypothetical protein A2381_17195 [Bdellovibrionales bacterium RIFOXYB1_FULL_37_110]|nr:MAG: hypothetical protein A2181_08200 [Bdellovibrionales bacterium RIFOXYA1_FULL_38_20]OFZ50131.1 MAG: hypothetical protein A2417_19030 [Bdellovibrionales bacterium RIFOXYC1_FULL_37_79]OFZ60037.1 MAG: hypothetical protein A2381_17195 [Bdellovibrionales bacterium RIFOXYB1_FULL_37_110]OFZ63025.1 MAG: hypothetical protein A2577_08900 [Bdellovibrionales bacterium RIFOXYD1_FULL_36_51]